MLRGYVDRLDVAPTGEVRVVDYKTGSAPGPDFEAKALFQMKFYALVLWRLRGAVPRLLQLMYLGGGGEVLRYAPDEADLLATERKVRALWTAIERALEYGRVAGAGAAGCATGATIRRCARSSAALPRRCPTGSRATRSRSNRRAATDEL